jgi:hypothetical protein
MLDPGGVFHRILQHIDKYDDPRGSKLSQTTSFEYANQFFIYDDGTMDIEAEQLVKSVIRKRKLDISNYRLAISTCEN